MKRPEQILGAVYDVDDTLLDNQPDAKDPMSNLHQVARYGAVCELAKRYGTKYPQLLEVSAQENLESFTKSPVHTVAGAFYTLLKNRGILDGDIDPSHPLILELLGLKNATYATLLDTSGKPIEGADTFVRDLSTEYGLDDRNAIASTAIFDDIKSFLKMAQLDDLFPDERIIDVSRVSRPKPDPEAFDLAFRSLHLADDDRCRVVAFEDDPRGMLSARKAGLYVCAITTRYSREFLESVEAEPDCIADTYDEFRDYFKI